jgi:hypothetical protein
VLCLCLAALFRPLCCSAPQCNSRSTVTVERPSAVSIGPNQSEGRRAAELPHKHCFEEVPSTHMSVSTYKHLGKTIVCLGFAGVPDYSNAAVACDDSLSIQLRHPIVWAKCTRALGMRALTVVCALSTLSCCAGCCGLSAFLSGVAVSR